jgi:DNA-binding ferritin-like protein
MEKVEELAAYYVAFLRSMYLIHQNNHWNSKGNDFYGNHLLFERIYKTAAEDSDLAAEKMIGLFGGDCIALGSQNSMINKIIAKYEDKESLIETSLSIEKDFLEFSKEFYDAAEKEDKLSLGLDDMIMSIASNREGTIYLLQQAGDNKMNSKISGRVAFLNRIKNSSTFVDKFKSEILKQLISRELNKHIELMMGKITVSYTPEEKRGNIKISPSCVVNLELKMPLPDEQHKKDIISLIQKTVQNSKVAPADTATSVVISP